MFNLIYFAQAVSAFFCITSLERACIECQPGTNGSTIGATSSEACEDCNTGQHRPSTSTDLTKCVLCNEGQHQNQKGQASCLNCEPGTTQNEKVLFIYMWPPIVVTYCSFVYCVPSFYLFFEYVVKISKSLSYFTLKADVQSNLFRPSRFCVLLHNFTGAGLY